MDSSELLAERFDARRPQMRSVAYRMLGSLTEVDDAVQEAWLRLDRAVGRTAAADSGGAIENLDAWLTTVVARVCLNLLRSRATRGEQALDEASELYVPDPVVARVDPADPEAAAILGESVGLALLVVLDTLSPDERLAFVLHDSFAVPFDDIAAILDTSPAAARQLASRARRRVQAAPTPDVDLALQRTVVDAFFAASRDGDFEGLVAVLHPDVLLRSDGGLTRSSASLLIRGGRTLASQAVIFAEGAPFAQPALVNGAAGVVISRRGRPLSVMAFVVRDGLIAEIDVLADPERLAQLDLSPWLG